MIQFAVITVAAANKKKGRVGMSRKAKVQRSTGS